MINDIIKKTNARIPKKPTTIIIPKPAPNPTALDNAQLVKEKYKGYADVDSLEYRVSISTKHFQSNNINFIGILGCISQ